MSLQTNGWQGKLQCCGSIARGTKIKGAIRTNISESILFKTRPVQTIAACVNFCITYICSNDAHCGFNWLRNHDTPFRHIKQPVFYVRVSNVSVLQLYHSRQTSPDH